jgi:hypothetical protein
MTTLAQARKLALALPEVTEEPHHDLSSFRVKGKIFATVPDDTHLRVMVDETEVRAAVADNPEACQECHWGKRLACVEVNLPRAGPDLVEELLTDAWIRKAPKKLVDALSHR